MLGNGRTIAVLLLAVVAQWSAISPVDAGEPGSGITISIPSGILVSTGGTVNIPILVDEADGIVGFNVRVLFDNSVVTVAGVGNGTLTAGWQQPLKNVQSDNVLIANFAVTPLSAGSGSLCVITFTGVGAHGARTNLVLEEARANDTPTLTMDGSVSIDNPQTNTPTNTPTNTAHLRRQILRSILQPTH